MNTQIARRLTWDRRHAVVTTFLVLYALMTAIIFSISPVTFDFASNPSATLYSSALALNVPLLACILCGLLPSMSRTIPLVACVSALAPFVIGTISELIKVVTHVTTFRFSAPWLIILEICLSVAVAIMMIFGVWSLMTKLARPHVVSWLAGPAPSSRWGRALHDHFGEFLLWLILFIVYILIGVPVLIISLNSSNAAQQPSNSLGLTVVAQMLFPIVGLCLSWEAIQDHLNGFWISAVSLVCACVLVLCNDLYFGDLAQSGWLFGLIVIAHVLGCCIGLIAQRFPSAAAQKAANN